MAKGENDGYIIDKAVVRYEFRTERSNNAEDVARMLEKAAEVIREKDQIPDEGILWWDGQSYLYLYFGESD